MLIDGFNHIFKLDFGRPGPTMIDDWFSRSFPAVHCNPHQNHKYEKHDWESESRVVEV